MSQTLLRALLLSAIVIEAAVIKSRQNVTKPSEPMCIGPGGKVAAPADALPAKIVMKSPGTLPGIERVKMRYGPWSVPNMTTKSVVGEGGSLWNCADYAEKPCEECTITRFIPGLEYANGSTANVDTGMWLHHVLLYTVGPTRWDPTCTGQDSVPHVSVGSDANHSERWAAAGNERSPIDFTQMRLGGKKTGYHLQKEDTFRILVDLMNMNMDDRLVYFTVEYDFVPGPTKKDEWLDLKPIWLDVDSCGMSEVKAPVNNGTFSIESVPWIPNFEGDIVGVGGHLHDGGVNLQIMASASSEACNSVAKYGETSDYIYKAANNSHSDSHIAEKHISSMSGCFNPMIPVKKLERSQSWILKGHYDFDRFEGNKEGDHQQDVMGLALMYVAVPTGGVPAPQ